MEGMKDGGLDYAMRVETRASSPVQTGNGASSIPVGQECPTHTGRFANKFLLNSRSCILMAQSFSNMKLGGFLLLLSGFGIVVTALRLLHGVALSVFILLGVAV